MPAVSNVFVAAKAVAELTNETSDPLQVICAWPVSGQYGTGTRVLYYVLIAACLVARREEWLVNPCLAAALVLPAVAAIHGIVLVAMHNPDAVDMDIFGAFQLCAIGILAAPVTVMMSKTYFNDPGRNTIFLWTFLLLIGLLSMTIEFYRIETHDCTKDAFGNPVSNIASNFSYIDGNNCGLICSTQDGPTSPMRGGSADNIYVIPAPHTLTFGAATLLGAACCVHAVLCLVSMWDRVLEINWRRRFGRQEEEDTASEDGDANKGVMKTVNDTIGFFLRILAVPVFGGAGLAILIVGEINFFSPPVDYQTEPMANIGQWAPITGTAMAMIGSLYLLLAKHAEEAGDPYMPHQCNCPHCHIDNSARHSQISHHASMSSLNSRHVGPSLSVIETHPTITTSQLSPNTDLTRPRSLISLQHREPSLEGHQSLNFPTRNPYRQKIENAFFRFGEIIGTPPHDYITEPKVRKPDHVDIPMIPGERYRNERVSAVERERDQHQDLEEEAPSMRSRSSSFRVNEGPPPNVERSASLPVTPAAAVIRARSRSRSNTGPRTRLPSFNYQS
ncbi:unnamed protein product [Fusarium graminearum]|uniref:Uncharacterized protein n=1 Tax=Gibberella zeae TaxID=5518 RepID=A0A9N8WUS6_GIBZA|nr:unnamed protein product [Fusarium graminearum]CAF3496016.1 unnamed protein product [Fusarium graminearum]CAF3525414.1 unnamed protein product [Fusarium graminearum]CAG1994402.1 unnamed protein product [Fusarium graminearum]